jgi:hypothetical protein
VEIMALEHLERESWVKQIAGINKRLNEAAR